MGRFILIKGGGTRSLGCGSCWPGEGPEAVSLA